MSNETDIQYLARKFVALEDTQRDLARARQLPTSSVRTVAGEDVRVGDGLEIATDASADVVTLQEDVSIQGDLGGESAEHFTQVPGWIKDTWDALDSNWTTVQTALENAAEALEAAANAEQTALGNTRVYSETEPTPPEGGWTVGAEWIKQVNGKAREVLVWNGTAFVHAQYLADEILIPGENGAIRLADGTVTAPAIAADAINGMTITGNTIIGGSISGSFFDLLGYGVPIPGLSDAMNSASPWVGNSSPNPTLSTAVFRSAPTSLRVETRGGNNWTWRGSLGIATNSGISGTVWAYSPTATEVMIRVTAPGLIRADSRTYTVPANEWTEIDFSFGKPVVEGLAWNNLYLMVAGDTPPTHIFWDDLALASTSVDDRRLSIERYTVTGAPAVIGRNGTRTRFRLDTGALHAGGAASFWSADGARAGSVNASGFSSATSGGTELILNSDGVRFQRQGTLSVLQTAIDSYSTSALVMSNRSGTGSVVIQAEGSGNVALGLASSSGNIQLRRPTTLLGAPVTALEAEGSLTPASGTTIQPVTMLLRDNHGVADVVVVCSRTSWTSGGTTTAATVPEGFRPPSTMTVAATVYGAGSPYVTFAQISSATGAVLLYNSPTNTQSWTFAMSARYRAVVP